MFYILAHMSYHLLSGGLGIRPFLDLWLLERRTVFDREKLRTMCGEAGLLPFYETGLQLTKVWLEGAAHTEAEPSAARTRRRSTAAQPTRHAIWPRTW